MSNLRLLKLKFDQILGLRTELFPIEALKCKLKKKVCFYVNVRSWGTEKFWNRVPREQSRGREKGVVKVACTRIPFSGEYPQVKMIDSNTDLIKWVI